MNSLYLDLIGMYLDAVLVFVTNSSLFFSLAVVILSFGQFSVHNFFCHFLIIMRQGLALLLSSILLRLRKGKNKVLDTYL